MLNLADLVILMLGVSVGSFVQSTSGIGFALVVVPVFLMILPDDLPSTIILLMILLNIYIYMSERDHADILGVIWITAGRIPGTLVGVFLLSQFSDRTIGYLVGASMLAAVGLTALKPSFRVTKKTFVGVGLFTGATETATGIGGPPIALIYQHRPSEVLRSTVACCSFVGQIVSAIGLAILGNIGSDQIRTTLMLLPALAAGIVGGKFVFRHIDRSRMRVSVLVLATASSVALLTRDLWQ